MKIQKSAEDYLEAILALSKKNGQVRSIDISHELNVTKPSVSYAVKRLRENGFLNVDSDGFITLNDSGMKIASKIYERHLLISEVLIYLGVDKKTAAEDACKIEHDLSEESFNAIRKHVIQAKSNEWHNNTKK